MGNWKAGILTIASAVVLATNAWAQTSSTIYDVDQLAAPTYYRINAQVDGTTTLASGSAVTLRYGGMWSQAGVNFVSQQNLSTYQGFRFTVRNEETRPIAIGLQWDNALPTPSAVGAIVNLRPLETKTFYVDFSGIVPASNGFNAALPALSEAYAHIYPNNPSFRLTSVSRFQVYSRESLPTRVTLSSVKGVATDSSLTGFVDVYGQLSRQSWPWKVTDINQFDLQRDDEAADLAQYPGTGETHGSLRLPTTPYTGRWRIVRTQSGKAYFLAPNGRYFWSMGMCQIIPDPSTIVQGRESMFGYLPPEGTSWAQFYSTTQKNGVNLRTYSHYNAALYEKFGDMWPTEYAYNAVRRLKSWGFNTVGTASAVWQLQDKGLPFTKTLTTAGFPSRLQAPFAYWRSLPDPYAPTFPTWLAANFALQLDSLKTNPNLLGVFVDGEQSWGLRSGTLRERYQVPIAALSAPGSQAAKQALINQLFVKYATIDTLNAAWQTSFTTWADLRQTPTTLTDAQVAAAANDLSVFLFNYTKTYAFRVRQAIKTLNPDINWLGTRECYAWTPNEVFSALQTQVDAISVTHYDQANDVPWNYYNALTKPVLISEFSFSAQEGNRMSQLLFQRCEAMSQAERATWTRDYVQRALTTKNIIGCHWFTYIDQPISGTANSENSAFGMVDVTDRPYPEMVDMFRTLSQTMYQRRGL